ncbi:MAG: transcription-repair coupling factor, partial [Cytophagales bacterium]
AENKKELVIFTYAEALSEKVISQMGLKNNTFLLKEGEKVDSDFLTELFSQYHFERSDFVYEPGQYAIRGGILDIFSFGNENPYRLELVGNEVESIRTFDPETQLSIKKVSEMCIVPNTQTKMMEEQRTSFSAYLPQNTLWFIHDYESVLSSIDKSFSKAVSKFDKITSQSDVQVISSPEDIFETAISLSESIQPFNKLHFGTTKKKWAEKEIKFKTESQPLFQKDFKKIAENLEEFRHKGYKCCIATESAPQFDKLVTIFEEINPLLKLSHLPVSVKEGFIEHQLKLLVYTDHQLFERYYGIKKKDKFSKNKALTLKELKTLQAGDYVVHADYGIGRFVGLERVKNGENEQEAIRLVFKDNDLLFVSIHSLHKISKYSGKEGTAPTMSKLGSPEWENKKKTVKKKVKDIAKELITLYAKRKLVPGYSFSKDSFLQAELETSFIYEDTPDQAKATRDVKEDMEKPHPMDRLVCGDVGFGKTEIAIRAAFKAVCDGKQVAVLVPTTVLAMQHHKTFRSRMDGLPCRVEYINRFKTNKQIKETLERVAEGKTDILIGTHRLVNKDVKFKDLGLLIIDEEQKFGVSIKDKLKEWKLNIDTLTLTATPIPRTLHFSLMGARDLSIIATPPPNRQPVSTQLAVFDKELIRDAVSYELERGGQVFFIHNRVNDLESLANTILSLVPDARIGIAHGQLDGEKLESVMVKFMEGEYDVLVSTNLVESGLDIPNANTIIINNSHMFGLSDLHQMRGRVGRSNQKAYCYLMIPSTNSLTTEARKRLSTLEEFSDLGDGFKVAMRDLDIRGAGNLLGAEQSGFISDIGFETYHQILDEAVEELKETEFKELFKDIAPDARKPKKVKECVVETDFALMIPENYINSTNERLSMYAEIDKISNPEQLKDFINAVTDKYGTPHRQFWELLKMVEVRWLAQDLGFEKLSIKNKTTRCFIDAKNQEYFNSEIFTKILNYVQINSKNCKLKELKDKLIFIIENTQSVEHLFIILNKIKG